MRRRQLEIQADTSERDESMHKGELVEKDDLGQSLHLLSC